MSANQTAIDNHAQPPRWMLPGAMLVALVIRGAVLWGMLGNLQHDPDAYRRIAEGLRKTGVYTLDVLEDEAFTGQTVTPTAYRPPLYPLLLAGLATKGNVSSLAVAALHLVLGLTTVYGVYALGIELGLRRASAIAALLVACDPILLQQSTLVMTETLATSLMVLGWWLLVRWDRTNRTTVLVLAGAALGLATLCRPTFLPWLGCAALIIVASSRSYSVSLRYAAILVASGLLVLAPWGIRNQWVFHQPIVTTTHGGYTLWLANNDQFYDYLLADQTTAWAVDPADHAAIKLAARSKSDSYVSHEILHSQAESNAAWETIRRRPGLFAYASAVRVAYLWSPLPQKTQPSESTYRVLARYLVALWYVAVYAAALVGLWKLRHSWRTASWLWGLSLCVVLTAIHAVYWSNLRMRAPAMPVVALLAAAGCAAGNSRPAPTLRR